METLGIVGCYGAIFLLIGFLVTVDNSRKVAALIQAVHKIAAGNLDTAVRVKGGDNLAMLGMTLNHMTDRLKKIIIHNLLKVRNEKFHEIATIIADWKNVQAADSQGKGLTVSTSFSRTGTSSSEFACSLPGTQGICYLLIGSGVHPGLKGAMESAMLYAAVDALIQAKNGGEIDPRPSEILTDLDKTFHRIAGGSFQGSLFVGMMDTCYGTMLYASAGNNVPVLVMQNSGEDPRLVGLKVPPAQKFAVIALDSQSEAIGNGAAQFEDKSITLQTGEKIVYYAKSVADSSRNGMTKLSTIAISQTLAGMGSFDGDAIIRNLSQLSRDAEQQNEADVAMVVAQFNKLEAAMPTKQPVLAASTALDPFDPFNPSGNAKESKPAPVAEGQPGSKKENALLGDFHFQETGSNVSPARAQSSTPPQHGAAKKLMEDLDDNPFVLGKAARTQTSQEQKEHLPRDEVALDVPAKDVELTNQLGSVGNVPTPPIAKPVQGAKNTGKAEPAHQVPSQEHSVQLSAHFEDEDEPKLAEGREMILPEAAPIASSDTHAVKLSANFVLDDEEEGKEKAAPARQATVPQDDLSHSGKKIKLSAFAQDEQDDVSLVSRTSPRPPSPPALPIKPVPPPPPGPGRAEAKKHDHEVPPTPDFTGAFGEQKIGSDAVLPPPPPTAEEWAGAYKAMGIAPMPETALDDADKTDGKEIEKGDLASMEPDAAPLFTVPQEAEADVPQLIQEELPEYHLDITSVNEADTAVRALAFEQVPSEEKNENGSNGGGDSLVRMLSRDFFPAVAQTSLLPSFDMENEFEKQDEDAATGPAEDVTLTFSGASDPAKKATEPMGSEVLPAPPSTRDKAKRNSAPAYFDDDDLFSLRKKPS